MKCKFNLLILGIIISSSLNAQHQETISFIENKGQWQKQVHYRAAIGGGYAWIENSGFTFHFFNQEDMENYHHFHHGESIPAGKQIIRQHAYKLNFKGTQQNIKPVAHQTKKEYYNFYLGNDTRKWASKAKSYEKISYADLYKGIHLEVTSQEGYFKYNFIVKAGNDPSLIGWNYEGAKTKIKNNTIFIQTQAGEVIEKSPVAWQEINGLRTYVKCEYRIKKGNFTFNFPEGYNKNYDLIIDPTLVFSSYSGSTADNWGFTATYDNNSSLYAGSVAFGLGYPMVGPFQSTFGGGSTDVALSKFTPSGNALVYSTYIGGNNSESPHSLITDANGNLYVYGTTSSSNFPTTAGAYDVTYNSGTAFSANGINYSAGSDLFVAKFDAAGSALIGSTFVGGTGNDGINNVVPLKFNYGDEFRGEINLDANNDVYIATCTKSADFPVTAGVVSTALSGVQDGCAFKLNSDLTTLQWGTFLGGTANDAAYSIKVSTDGNAYICGGTTSTNFHNTGAGLINTAPGGAADAFIISISATNGAYTNATYLGTNLYDQAYMLEIDIDNDIYVVGQTRGVYPVSAGVYNNANSSQFIHKLNSALNTTQFSTVFGSGNVNTTNISPSAFLVDNCKNIYVSGWGGTVNSSAGGNTNNMAVTADAYDAVTDGSDFYFIVLQKDALSLLYGSYFGGSPAEHVDGGTSRFDKNGVIYQAVCAGCGGSDNFPTTAGAWSQTNNSTNCNIGVIKMEFSYQGVNANANAAPNIIACDPPFDVNFTGSTGVPDHYWDFGDQTGTSTLQNPTYTFADTGSFTIMYVAIDSASCNIADTAYLSVVILEPQEFSAVIDIPPYNPCSGDTLIVDLEFTGTGADSLVWDMGDGTIYTNDTLIAHPYTSPGTYILTLTAYDYDCNQVESISDTVSYSSNTVFANANAAPNVIACDPPFIVNFTGSSSPQHFWDFGDGTGTSTLANPAYTFADTGSFTITYIAIDSSSCNFSDTAYLNVTILASEDFSAVFSPVPPQPCSDSVLVNIAFTGTGADSLVWNMGDSTVFIDQQNISYVYTTPGLYTITLTAYDFTCNKVGTFSQTITVDESVVNGDFKIPNIITPNGDELNNEFKPFYSNLPGFDVLANMETYECEIYDRWGVKMFSSAGGAQTWDGKFEGKPVPEGVYYYIIKYQLKCWDQEVKVEHGHVTVTR